jgi:hypothetical protein
MAIFTLAEGESFPRPTGQVGKVMALDRGGEIYFTGKDQRAFNPGAGIPGSLFRWKGEGTSPRVWIENIQECDLGPDGRNLALIRYQESLTSGTPSFATLESPPGKILARSQIWMTCPRWSPDGNYIAYIQHVGDDWDGRIVVVDPQGHQRFQSELLDSICSLAWSPDSQEIVFTTDLGFRRHTTIAAMDLRGRRRELLSSGQDLFLMDIDPKGRLLLSSTIRIQRKMIERVGHIEELILPFRSGMGCVLSPDGSKAAFAGLESDQTTCIYVRDQASGTLVRLTPGCLPLAFTPDNAWLLIDKSQTRNRNNQPMALVPLGPGAEVLLDAKGLLGCNLGLLPDQNHPIVRANLPDGTFAWFLLDPQHPPKRIAQQIDIPEACEIVSTDMGSLWSFDFKRGLVHGSLSTSSWESIGGALANRVPLAWDSTTRELLVVSRQQFLDPELQGSPKVPLELEWLNPKTLKIRPNRILKFPDLDSTDYVLRFASGATMAAGLDYKGHLFIVDGLLPPRKK